MLISFSAWLDKTPFLLLGGLLVISMTLSAACGFVFRRRRDHLHAKRGRGQAEGQEGYVVSAVLGLLALLLGFTFSLAIDRFEARRHLVLEDANAIGTAYLRVQLLQEPHRTRLSNLLVQYTDNMVNLAKVPPDRVPSLIATDDRLLTDIWAATAAGFESIRGIDFSSTLIESMNNLIDLDAARRAARQAHVPTVVFVVLLLYMVVSAGVSGYVLSAPRGRWEAPFLMGLLTMSLLLIIDIRLPD